MWRSSRLVIIWTLLFVVLCFGTVDCNGPAWGVVNVMDFGAVGDGVTDDSCAIRQAMVTAASMSSPQSSVTVLFPNEKTFLTGPLNMSSYMTLQIDGALHAKNGMDSKNGSLQDWAEIPPLPSYGDSRDGPYLQYQAFIYARDATDIHITGNGTIHGKGEWWWTNRPNRSLVKSGRPNLIQLVNCTNVEISYITLRDSPFWTLHPVYCTNVYIHHTTITSRMYAPNVDGIDPDSCQNVMIEHNDISCGDDHIAIKAGVCGTSSPNDCVADQRFRNGSFQTNNVTVRYNTFRIGMGIAIGSESSGSIRNVHVHDNVVGLCEFGHCLEKCCGWGPALHVKTTMSRGGVIENILFQNNTVYNTSAFVLVEMDYQTSGGGQPPKNYPPTKVRNISLVGNRALGRAVGASFSCSKQDACQEIVVVNNTIVNADMDHPPWSCHNVRAYSVWGNYPPGLEECMRNSTMDDEGLPEWTSTTR